jgi:signal transduction histidine kinase
MLIVKNIVEAHGGSVLLSSEPGVGTRVLLSFPLRS